MHHFLTCDLAQFIIYNAYAVCFAFDVVCSYRTIHATGRDDHAMSDRATRDNLSERSHTFLAGPIFQCI